MKLGKLLVFIVQPYLHFHQYKIHLVKASLDRSILIDESGMVMPMYTNSFPNSTLNMPFSSLALASCMDQY